MQRNLKILLMASSLFMLAGGLFGPIYAVCVEEIGGDLLTAGAAYSIFAIVAGIMIFLIGRWEDRVKHQEKLIIIGYVLSCAGFLGYLFVKAPVHLFMVQIIFGVGEAIGTPAFDGLYTKHLDKGKFASEWGMWDAMSYITIGIGALAGGYLANLYGFRFLFTIMFVISLLGLFTSIFLTAKSKKQGARRS